MCDTLCAIAPERTLFAKNSDRPSSEVQLIESFPRRNSAGSISATHIEVPGAGAVALLGARPAWGWGLEHGVNAHGVAIGNEELYTALSPKDAAPALTGMDLVRLALERARTADEALDTITSLLEEHGQGGACTEDGHAYFSSFLMADPGSAWVLETSGRSWAAKPVDKTAAISNRITIGADWTRASADIEAGTDFDTFRHPTAPTGHADNRLAASRACLAQGDESLTPAHLAAHLRDHGTGPWGIPGAVAPIEPPPETIEADGTGVTVCMHVRGIRNTTSSMIAELPSHEGTPLRAWVAPGSPCVSVFVPVFPPAAVPTALSEPAVWHSFALLRNAVEADGGILPEVRLVFDPLEAQIWADADDVALTPDRHERYIGDAWQRVAEALETVLKNVRVPG